MSSDGDGEDDDGDDDEDDDGDDDGDDEENDDDDDDDEDQKLARGTITPVGSKPPCRGVLMPLNGFAYLKLLKPRLEP